jgi:hypothetical protein
MRRVAGTRRLASVAAASSVAAACSLRGERKALLEINSVARTPLPRELRHQNKSEIAIEA